MKKIGSNCGFISHRNRELAEKARRLAVSRGVGEYDVAQEVAESEASKFWIDEDRAVRLVREHRRGIVQKRKPREAMAAEITRRTEAMLNQNPKLSLTDAVFEVVNSPAPSYYISERSVRRAIASRKRGFIPEYQTETDDETQVKERKEVAL